MKPSTPNAEHWMLDTGRCVHWLDWFNPSQPVSESANQRDVTTGVRSEKPRMGRMRGSPGARCRSPSDGPSPWNGNTATPNRGRGRFPPFPGSRPDSRKATHHTQRSSGVSHHRHGMCGGEGVAHKHGEIGRDQQTTVPGSFCAATKGPGLFLTR